MKKVTNVIKFAVRKYCDICHRLTLACRIIVTSLTGVALVCVATLAVHHLNNLLSSNVNEICLAVIVAINVYVSRNPLRRAPDPAMATNEQLAPAYEQKAASKASLGYLSGELCAEPF